MKKYFSNTLCFLGIVARTAAQDITRLEKIGDASSLTRTENSVVLNCKDNSKVRITMLAPDLIRVCASFSKQMLDRDHSWAIHKTTWQTPRWSLSERTEAIAIKTDEVEVIIRRSPTGTQTSAASDPLASQEQSYYVFSEGVSKNYFQKRKDGRLFVPRVWPGESVFVDYTLPEARRWWGDLHRAYTDFGVAGYESVPQRGSLWVRSKVPATPIQPG